MFVCSDSHSLDSDRYCIIGADLRDISTMDEKLKKFQLNPEYVTDIGSSQYKMQLNKWAGFEEVNLRSMWFLQNLLLLESIVTYVNWVICEWQTAFYSHVLILKIHFYILIWMIRRFFFSMTGSCLWRGQLTLRLSGRNFSNWCFSRQVSLFQETVECQLFYFKF